MKGQGIFRRMALRVKEKITGKPAGVERSHPDPMLRAPEKRTRSRRSKPTVRRRTLSCEPGTIVYHDKLVKHFGSRQARKYGRIIQAGQMDLLPTEQEFQDNPPWAYLSTGTG